MKDTRELLYQGKFVELIRDGRWEYVRRVNAHGAVFVLAVTPARELVLVEQYRVPVRARTLELPAGIYGDADSPPDETPEACALRELEEETGFRGGRAQRIFSGPVAPGLTNEIMHLVRADELTRVSAGGGVGGEDIRVHLVPLGEAEAWLSARSAEGLLVEPRVYAGLWVLGKR